MLARRLVSGSWDISSWGMLSPSGEATQRHPQLPGKVPVDRQRVRSEEQKRLPQVRCPRRGTARVGGASVLPAHRASLTSASTPPLPVIPSHAYQAPLPHSASSLFTYLNSISSSVL